MHLDHVVDKSRGGLGTLDNSQWLHPYCDSTAKNLLMTT
jgi:HNH endonuclease